jgi:hypothetical protein
MRLKAIVLVTAFTMTSSLALAQRPAPIGSSADFGNGALINRGPVGTHSMDRDFRLNRAYGYSTRHYRRRHVADHWR